MRYNKTARILALGLATGAALSFGLAANANAAKPPVLLPGLNSPGNPPYGGPVTFSVSRGIGHKGTSEAYSVAASGLLGITKISDVTCTSDTAAVKTAVAASLAPVASLGALNTGCAFGSAAGAPSGAGNADSVIAGISLLGGAITVTGVDSECGVARGDGFDLYDGTHVGDGDAFAGSHLGSLGGSAFGATAPPTQLGNGYGRLILPDLLTVEYNDSEYLTVKVAGVKQHELVNYAVKITVGKTLTIAGKTYTAGEVITVGECDLVSGKGSNPQPPLD